MNDGTATGGFLSVQGANPLAADCRHLAIHF